MSRLFERFAQTVLQPLDRAVLKLLSVYTILWGLWVANPFWDVFSRAGLYTQLYAVGPEMFWGLLAFSCGLALLLSCIKKSRKWMLRSSSIMGWHWFMVAIFYFLGDWHNTGGLTSLLLACYAAVIYLNLKVSDRTVDEMWR